MFILLILGLVFLFVYPPLGILFLLLAGVMLFFTVIAVSVQGMAILSYLIYQGAKFLGIKLDMGKSSDLEKRILAQIKLQGL